MMTLRDQLRTWLNIGEDTGPRTKVTDEHVLNPLRQDDLPDDLTTQEIADELPIGRRQTGNRLKEMEGKRVEKRRAGSTDMWALAEEERETVVQPEMGPVVARSSKLRRQAAEIREPGLQSAAGAFVFLFVGLTLSISNVGAPSSIELLLALGYAAGIVGAGLVGASELLRLVGLTAPKLVERFLMD